MKSSVIIIKGLDTSGRFSAMSDKGDNFCYFLFAFLRTKPLPGRCHLLNEKEFAPKGSKLFPFREAPFKKGGKNTLTVLTDLSPLKVYLSSLKKCLFIRNMHTLKYYYIGIQYKTTN